MSTSAVRERPGLAGRSTTARRPADNAASIPAAGRWCGATLIALGACVSLLGPLVAGAIHHRVSHIHHSQLLGLDAISLAVVAPLAIGAGVLALRRRPEWPLLAIGPALYVLYMVPHPMKGRVEDVPHGKADQDRPQRGEAGLLNHRHGLTPLCSPVRDRHARQLRPVTSAVA